MYFFTADEHYFHKNIIRYCQRPFSSVEEMNRTLINNHNSVVCQNDIVFHLGDFCFKTKHFVSILHRLNGKHYFIPGNHDKWLEYLNSNQVHSIEVDRIYLPLPQNFGGILLAEHSLFINNKLIVCSHYSMRVWNRSCHGSWHVYGHSHGSLPHLKNSWDVGVDNNNYFPVSFSVLKEKMEENNARLLQVPR